MFSGVGFWGSPGEYRASKPLERRCNLSAHCILSPAIRSASLRTLVFILYQNIFRYSMLKPKPSLSSQTTWRFSSRRPYKRNSTSEQDAERAACPFRVLCHCVFSLKIVVLGKDHPFFTGGTQPRGSGVAGAGAMASLWRPSTYSFPLRREILAQAGAAYSVSPPATRE